MTLSLRVLFVAIACVGISAADIVLTDDTRLVFGSSISNLYETAGGPIAIKTDGNLIVNGNLTVLGSAQFGAASTFSVAYAPLQTVVQNGPTVALPLIATHGSCNIVNGQYVAPIAGWYSVTLNALTSNMSQQAMFVYILKNGIQVYSSLGSAWQGSTAVYWSSTYAIQLAVGDKVSFVAQLEFGTAPNQIELTQAYFRFIQ